MPEQEQNAQQPEPETPAQKQRPKNKTPDWKPLGTVRDYFTEQMKQDGFYGR
jgi:hypothetical protein